MAENTTEVCTAGSVPEETAVAVGDVGIGGCLEAVVFALALDAEDVHDLIAHVVCLAARVLEVVLEFDELV